MNKALLVGLTNYQNNTLDGTITDVNCLEKILSRHYDDTKNFDCDKIIKVSTRKELRKKLIEFFFKT
ncbi:caspase family protein [Candidatus Endomicrobiellum trichonymphae]|uniref:caspase family protein n=1 Tax=Endomicrobium trichonymphae TaxID=1408204 RepID=UPI000BBA9752|nr:caspase family protein [Candidatus Endomicrobium trichonymphae]